MKNILILVILFTSGQYCKAQVDDISPEVDSVFAFVKAHAPGYMIAAIKDDAFIFQKGYGLANLEHNIPISSKTNFNIASLSKQFTAAAIAILILENKINLEDDVSTYLVDFPFARDSVKIKHLIYMTSGINDYYYNPRESGADWSSLQFFNVDTAIQASYRSGELMYKPGSQWSYSNINYMLLTRVVEQVSGISFSEFVRKNIFLPLGMNDTYVNDDIFQIIPNRALGYNHRDEENTSWLVESNYLKKAGEGFMQIHRNSPHYGGSGVYTTMEDFQKWLSNYHTKSFGGQAFYDLMHKTMKFEHEKANDAFGLVLDKYEDKEVVWYEGGDWGFSAFMIRFTASNTAIVCFSNLGTGHAKSKVWALYDILKAHSLID